MHIDMQGSLLASKNATQNTLTHAIKHQASLQATPSSERGTVTISDAARRAASLDPIGDNAAISAITELHSLIKQYDFHSITPRQMANLAGELFKRGEISNEAACSFIGVEMNTVVERDPNKPIDMVAHFKFMLDTVATAASGDATLSYAAANRKQASQALADVISFANSDRQHI